VLDVTGAEERAVTKDELLRCPEAFLSSTAREVQPVSQIEDLELAAPGELTERTAAALREHIAAQLG
jgi:branched-subunit amino acid aminotransferase/4-amino-4-deoxychorismate lyase